MKTNHFTHIILGGALTLVGATAQQATANESAKQVTLALPAQPATSILEQILQHEGSRMGTTALVLDDGTAENSIGDNGQFIWLNRFTPDPSEFPFELEEVSAMFGSNNTNIGDAIEILVYEDTDGDGDPATGAVLLDSFNVTIQTNDLATFNVYLLDQSVLLNGPGDVLIGLVNRAGSEGFSDFPAALDQTNSAVRSWAATYNVGDVPAAPTLPGDEQWGTIDSFGFAGNWVIRGAGVSSDLIFRDGFD